MPDYFVQEEDGTSRIELEEGDGFLLLEEGVDPNSCFVSVGALGTANTKSAGTTLTVSPTRDVPAGNVIGIWYVWDGGRSLGEILAMHSRWSAYDTAGNLYSTLMATAEDFGHPAAGFFICRLRNDLLTTDTITLECQIAGQTYKALSMWEWELGANNRWAVAEAITNTNRLADPAAIATSTLPSREYLFIHVLGQQGPSTDAFTLDADYTPITQHGTTGGADSSNGTIAGGFRIATLTSDSLDVSSDTADRDYWQGIIPIACVPYYDTFPQAAIYDNFNRANENPLDGGLWQIGSNEPTSGNSKGRIVSNQAAPQSGTLGGSWVLDSLTDDVEAYATFPTLGSNAGLLVTGSGDGGSSTRGGSEAVWIPITFGHSVKDRIELGEAANTSLVAVKKLMLWFDQASGRKMGIQRIDKVMNLWIDDGSGWEWAAAWYDYGSAGSGGLAGFEIYEPVRMDDFGCADWVLITLGRFYGYIID